MPFTPSKKAQAMQSAFDAWKLDPSPDNYSAVTQHLEPTINNAMHSFAGDDPGLKTRARILTSQALQTYDPQAGAALNTHVYTQLQRLQRYRAERSRMLHIPENVRLDKGLLDKYTNEHVNLHGVEPSDVQLADATGISIRRIRRTRTGGEISASQSEGDKGDLPGARRRSRDEIWTDYVYHDLDERSRKIMEWTTGYNKQPILKKQDIAAKLGITPAAVSIRINQIISKLQEGTA
jgi:DNA-directed RNA polymerase specialized sigma subunit